MVYSIVFKDWKESVNRLLDEAGLIDALKGRGRVILKPNLVDALQPPITTPAMLIQAVVRYIKERITNVEIIIAEGSGSLKSTLEVFKTLGYVEMAWKNGARLFDLNEEDQVMLSRPEYKRWPKIYLPKIIIDAYLISIPVLKAHSLAKVTLSMKNMVGVVSPKYYQTGGQWKKSAFHKEIDQAVFELNRYRTPDFSIIDATVGMKDGHLWGEKCKPAPNLLLASHDPVAIDAYGAMILKRNWQDVGHIALANGVLGKANPDEVTIIE